MSQSIEFFDIYSNLDTNKTLLNKKWKLHVQVVICNILLFKIVIINNGHTLKHF